MSLNCQSKPPQHFGRPSELSEESLCYSLLVLPENPSPAVWASPPNEKNPGMVLHRRLLWTPKSSACSARELLSQRAGEGLRSSVLWRICCSKCAVGWGLLHNGLSHRVHDTGLDRLVFGAWRWAMTCSSRCLLRNSSCRFIHFYYWNGENIEWSSCQCHSSFHFASAPVWALNMFSPPLWIFRLKLSWVVEVNDPKPFKTYQAHKTTSELLLKSTSTSILNAPRQIFTGNL